MLTGVFLAILLALVMVPFALMGDDDDDGHDDDPAPAPDPEDSALSGDTSDAAGQDEAPAHVGGLDHEPPEIQHDDPLVFKVGAEDGTMAIVGFRPGVDMISVSLDLWGTELSEGHGPNGAELQIGTGEGGTVLCFDGLDELPLADIVLVISSPGEEPVSLTLAEVLEQNVDDAIEPADPDAQDDLPESPLTGSALSPTDPETPEDQPVPILEAQPIAPTDPDAPEDASTFLSGHAVSTISVEEASTSPPDTSVTFIEQDISAGDEVASAAELDVTVVEDFVLGEDVLEVTLDCGAFGRFPQVVIFRLPGSVDSELFANGVRLAIVKGVPGLTQSDVYVRLAGCHAA